MIDYIASLGQRLAFFAVAFLLGCIWAGLSLGLAR